MSTNHTPNLGLSQWVRTDPFNMDEFNENNAKIDEEVGKVVNSCSYVKLIGITVPQDITEIQLDMSEFDMENILTLEVFVQPKKVYGKAPYIRMRPNNMASGSDYRCFLSNEGRWVDGETSISLEMGFCRFGFGNTDYGQFIHNSIASNCCRRMPRLNKPSQINRINFFGQNNWQISAGSKIVIMGVMV